MRLEKLPFDVVLLVGRVKPLGQIEPEAVPLEAGAVPAVAAWNE